MSADQARPTVSPAPRAAAARWLCASALSLLGVGALASALRLPDAQLENAFWACDAVATQQALPPRGVAQCARFADELKRRRFGGDLEKFQAWHRERKHDEHEKRLTSPLAYYRLP